MTTSTRPLLNEHRADGDETIASIVFVEPAAPIEPTYRDWLCNNALKSRWMTYFMAFYLHWLILLCLGAVCLHIPETFEPLLLNAIFTDEDLMDDSSFEIVTTEFETDVAETLQAESQSAAATTSLLASTIVPKMDLPAVSDAFAALAVPDNSSDTAATAQAKNRPDIGAINVPRHAVTAGSFSVWTVPDNPAPGEPYKIVIQIRLPEGTEKYSVTDLDGIVVGSDGYQKLIPGSVRGNLPINDGRVKLEVYVVSADLRVEDTVFVKSKMLREAQRMKIRF